MQREQLDTLFVIQTRIPVIRFDYYSEFETPHSRLGMESVDVEEVSLP